MPRRTHPLTTLASLARAVLFLAVCQAANAAETITGRVVGVTDGDTLRKQVAIEVETIDNYGRAVGRALVNGTDINLEQVKRGMAWVYRNYAHDSAYFAAEDAAKAARIGLWSRTDAMPPWEFRHSRKSGDDGFLSMLRDLFNWKTRSTTTGATASGTCGSKQYCKEMTRELALDAVALGLLITAMIPWASDLIRRLELPSGFKLEFQELRGEVEQQKREIDRLTEFLFTHFVTDAEFKHLEALHTGQTYLFQRASHYR